MVCADARIRSADPRPLRRSVRARSDRRTECLGADPGGLSRAVRPARSDAAQHVSRHAAGLRHRPQGPRGRDASRRAGASIGACRPSRSSSCICRSRTASGSPIRRARWRCSSQPAWTRPWPTCGAIWRSSAGSGDFPIETRSWGGRARPRSRSFWRRIPRTTAKASSDLTGRSDRPTRIAPTGSGRQSGR